jgi:hypothetical protein
MRTLGHPNSSPGSTRQPYRRPDRRPDGRLSAGSAPSNWVASDSTSGSASTRVARVPAGLPCAQPGSVSTSVIPRPSAAACSTWSTTPDRLGASSSSSASSATWVALRRCFTLLVSLAPAMVASKCSPIGPDPGRRQPSRDFGVPMPNQRER